MVLALNYRRPSHVSTSRDSLSGEEKQRSINESIQSGSSGSSIGIPDALSFDRIIAGGVCPVSSPFFYGCYFFAKTWQPLTVRDFMNYLKYIEHDAENLQFYLWIRSYSQRFANLSDAEQALSPPWTAAQAEAEAPAGANARQKKFDPVVTSILQGTDFADKGPKAAERHDPFNDTGSRTPSTEEEKRDYGVSDYGSSYGDTKTMTAGSAYASKAEDAFDDAGLQWKPCKH